MVLVIDAYNVLKSSGLHEYIEDNDQERFIRLLGKYGKRKEHAIVIVFDGGHYIHPFRATRHGATVVYSGMKESADTYIKRYLRENKERDLLLISSDRELALLASQLGVISMNAIEFYELVRQEMRREHAPSSNQPAVKLTDREQPELDMLMYASGTPRAKSDDVAPDAKQKTKKPHILSKAERAMMKKIKKL